MALSERDLILARMLRDMQAQLTSHERAIEQLAEHFGGNDFDLKKHQENMAKLREAAKDIEVISLEKLDPRIAAALDADRPLTSPPEKGENSH